MSPRALGHMYVLLLQPAFLPDVSHLHGTEAAGGFLVVGVDAGVGQGQRVAADGAIADLGRARGRQARR